MLSAWRPCVREAGLADLVTVAQRITKKNQGSRPVSGGRKESSDRGARLTIMVGVAPAPGLGVLLGRAFCCGRSAHTEPRLRDVARDCGERWSSLARFWRHHAGRVIFGCDCFAYHRCTLVVRPCGELHRPAFNGSLSFVPGSDENDPCTGNSAGSDEPRRKSDE